MLLAVRMLDLYDVFNVNIEIIDIRNRNCPYTYDILVRFVLLRIKMFFRLKMCFYLRRLIRDRAKYQLHTFLPTLPFSLSFW